MEPTQLIGSLNFSGDDSIVTSSGIGYTFNCIYCLTMTIKDYLCDGDCDDAATCSPGCCMSCMMASNHHQNYYTVYHNSFEYVDCSAGEWS